jgi:hypothetical protein
VNLSSLRTEILETQPGQFHLACLLGWRLEAHKLEFRKERSAELENLRLEDGSAGVSCVASCSGESVDDGQCELLWVLSGVHKGFGELENVRTVFSDVFSGLRLRRQLLDLILNALEVRERVLLYDLNQSEPVNREQSVLLFIRCEVLERLQKLLVE